MAVGGAVVLVVAVLETGRWGLVRVGGVLCCGSMWCSAVVNDVEVEELKVIINLDVGTTGP